MLAALSSCVFVVRERDYALVFSLGEVRKVISEPGLYFKAPPPFQNVVTLDKRILTIETDERRTHPDFGKEEPADRLLREVAHRRPAPVLRHVRRQRARRAGAPAGADPRRPRTRRSTCARCSDVVSAERDKVMAEILTNVAKRAEPLGVQIVDVRLRRIEFAPEISESVYRRMEAERTRVANELRSIGAAEGEKIRARSRPPAARSSWPQAYAKAQGIMGEGDAAASSIYARLYGKDPEFYTYYKSLEAYRASFSKPGDVLVVDPSSELLPVLQVFRGCAGRRSPCPWAGSSGSP